MNDELWNKAYERLSIYGENPPAVCWSRLAAEKAALHETDAIQSFAVLGRIQEEAQKNNTLIHEVGMMSSSFAAWLLGATKVNPLPPHYRCGKCGKTEFVDDVADGFDLPVKKCSCGTELIRGMDMIFHLRGIWKQYSAGQGLAFISPKNSCQLQLRCLKRFMKEKQKYYR